MELLIGLLVVNLLISCIVGWVSNQRGRSFWLGFWLSAFLSPILGVLILMALPGGSGVSPENSVAAREWLKVRNSLDGRDYDDFIQVLPGTAEAVLATQHKRLLQDWQAIDNLDGQAIGEFMQRRMFPALADEIRRVIERNAANSSTCFELLGRIKA